MKIPKVVNGLAGPIVVVIVEGEINKDATCLGLASFAPRTIQIKRLSSADVMLSTFWHEVFHFALYDSGLHNRMTEEEQEQLCDLAGATMGRATGRA